jgi:hypothetical protein
MAILAPGPGVRVTRCLAAGAFRGDPRPGRPLRCTADLVDEADMARRSLRDLLRKKREKKALSSEMRTLLDSFEAQYGQRDPQNASRSSTTTGRASDESASR